MQYDQGNKWTWAKPKPKGSAKLENSYIVYSELWEPYHPFDFPNLPNALSRVDSAGAAIEFVNNYGMLGYHSFFPELEQSEGTAYMFKGDPVDWFVYQAKTIKFVLYLIKMIQEDDNKKIISFIKDAMVQVSLNVFYKNAPEESKATAHVFAIGPNTEYRLYPGDQEIWKNKQKLLAMQMGAYLINANSKGVQRLLSLDSKQSILIKPYKFAQINSSRSLIEAIWHMVGNAALLSQESKGRGVRTCLECGLPFIVTDLRQKYCPGDEYSKGSLCGNRARVRKTRQKKEGN